MSLSTITPLLIEATKNKRALGAYNVYTLDQIDALIEVHEQHKSSLIIQVADPANGFLGGNPDFMNAPACDRRKGAMAIGAKFQAAAAKTKIDVCLHLDHGKSLEAIKNAIEAGFTSVMFDGSHLPYEENVRMTKEAADLAHSHGVSIEAELGVLGGTEDDVHSDHSYFTKPEEALDFVIRTGVDCLAISYGTQHGANKGKNTVLRNDIVEGVGQLLKANDIECPLVSHGSSTVPKDIVESINALGGKISNAYGIKPDQMSKAVYSGIAKINVDTDIRLATTLAFLKYIETHEPLPEGIRKVSQVLAADPTSFDPRVFLVPVMDQVINIDGQTHETPLITRLLKEAVFNICNRTIPVFSRTGVGVAYES